MAFDKIVKRRVLFDVERKLQKSELNLSFVTIQPHFPEDPFRRIIIRSLWRSFDAGSPA